MAFLPQGQEQQQQGQQANQNQIPTVPVIPSLAGSGGPSTGQGAGTGVQNTASPAAAPSSPWQNVTSYLQANAGQAGSVADTIGGNLTSQYNQANQGIQNANTNFGQQIQSARVPLDQQLAQQAASSPSQVASDPSQLAAFQKMYNANYGGPQDFSHSADYSNLQAQVQKAQQQAALVNQGTPGLMTLLQQAEAANGRNPTQGVTALDSLLLQEDPSNFGKLSAAAAPFAGLTDYLGQTQTGLDTAAQQAAQEAAATKQSLQNQFVGPGGVVPSWQNREAAQLQDLSKQATGFNTSVNDILGKLNSGQPLTSDDMAMLGITPSYGGGWNADQMNRLIGQGGVFQGTLGQGIVPVGPNYMAQFLTPAQQLAQPNLANVSSPQEYADAQALNQLLGFDTGLAQAPQDYSIPTQRGSFDVGTALNSLENEYRNMPNIVLNPDQAKTYNDLYNQMQWGLSGYTDANPPPPTPGDPYPTPTTPMPTDGGLGAGYNWNPQTGQWDVNIPLQPPGSTSGGTSPGGGRHFF